MQTQEHEKLLEIIAFISQIEKKKKRLYFSNKIKLIWSVFCYVLLYSIYLNFGLCYHVSSLIKKKNRGEQKNHFENV